MKNSGVPNIASKMVRFQSPDDFINIPKNLNCKILPLLMTRRLVLVFLLLIIQVTVLSSQFICGLEQRSGSYAKGGAALSYTIGKQHSGFHFEEQADDLINIVDTTGRVVMSGLRQVITKVDGLILIQNSRGKWGVFRKDFSELISDVYDDLFYENIQPGFNCLVKIGEHWGAVDSMGNSILPVVYSNIQMLTDQVAFLEKDDANYLFFFGNRRVFPLNDFCVKLPGDDLNPGAILLGRDSLVGALDLGGLFLVEPQYGDLSYRKFRKRDSGFYFVSSMNGKMGLINSEGEIIADNMYDKISILVLGSTMDSSLFLLERHGKMFVSYRSQISKYSFSIVGLARALQSQYLIVSSLNKYGLYHYGQDELVIKPKYEELQARRNSTLIAKRKGKFGVISKSGEILLKLKYDVKPEFLRKGSHYPQELVKVQRKGLVGFADENYEIVLRPKYHVLKDFNEGRAVVMKDGKWGYIDQDFEEVIGLKYEYATPFHEGEAMVVLGEREIVINLKGHCIRNCN